MMRAGNGERGDRICDDAVLRAAWRRVLGNKGCRGSDGVTLEMFAGHLERNLERLRRDLLSKSYHPFPLLRFPVPKEESKKLRYLSVPCVRDRVAQTAVFLATGDLFEKEFEGVSHAYRLGRGVHTAITEIEKLRDKGFRYAVDADIEGFFDNVSHTLLLNKLEKIIKDPFIMRLFKKWIRAEVYDGRKIWRLRKGIPQGSVVSPFLANLYLDELDEMLLDFGKKLVRYSDDFLVLSRSRSAAGEDLELTDMVLDDLKLKLHPFKTRIVSFEQGFKFLGAVFLYNTTYVFPPRRKKGKNVPKLPPPLTLKRYLELRNRE